MVISDLFAVFGSTKEEKEIQQKYRNVFSSPEGKEVLTHLLSLLHFFDEMVVEDDIVLRNFAYKLLGILGIWQSMNASRIVETFLRMPITPSE